MAEKISIKNAKVYKGKPKDRIKGLLYGLDKDGAFILTELAEEWGMSPETLSSHAKKFDAARYVEVSPGNFAFCVLHPDTAKKYIG